MSVQWKPEAYYNLTRVRGNSSFHSLAHSDSRLRTELYRIEEKIVLLLLSPHIQEVTSRSVDHISRYSDACYSNSEESSCRKARTRGPDVVRPLSIVAFYNIHSYVRIDFTLLKTPIVFIDTNYSFMWVWNWSLTLIVREQHRLSLMRKVGGNRKGNEMGGTCSTYGEVDKWKQKFRRKVSQEETTSES